MSETEGNQPILDVAIAGGGISGVYSGWRILGTEIGNGKSIAVFEGGERIGGRLLSVIPPQIPDARVELGGMRYIKESHKYVAGLVDELKLPTKPLPAGKLTNLAYLRRDRLKQSELTDSSKLPFNLREDESSKEDLESLTALAAVRSLKGAFKEVLNFDLTLETLPNVTEADWEKVAQEGKYEGVLLSDTPMRYMMLRSISHEAFRLAEESSGYDSILFTWNAADGFPWNLADFGTETKYTHVTDGYDRVPLMLQEQFEERGGQIHLKTRVNSFDDIDLPDGTKGVSLVIEDAVGTRTVLARKLILAMPKRSLELMEQTGPLLDPAQTEVRALINTVTPIPLFKIAICYETPWWEKVVGPDSSGESVTDLPVRQCYYWKVDRKNDHAVVLIYDDGAALDYWSGLRNLKAKSGGGVFENHPSCTPDGPDLPDWFNYPAPKRMVEEVHRQLLELHGCKEADVPQPYAAAYRDWGEDPYGGGANFWHVGSRSYEVGHAIIHPRPDVPIYICGECWSHGQGWVEGALATAEEMLQKNFDLKPPPWVPVSDKS